MLVSVDTCEPLKGQKPLYQRSVTIYKSIYKTCKDTFIDVFFKHIVPM